MKFKVSPLRQRQFIGIIAGIGVGTALFAFFTFEPTGQYISLGPMNTGHDNISCSACHLDAKGNLTQQLQSNVAHAFGGRDKDVFFGTQDVTVDNCLQCHDRPNDRHPTYRFEEPRFADATEVINATTCITCHSEHHDERISLAKLDYCMNCHTDLAVENDPLDIPHVTLAANEQWSTCIQCHDFHGNHDYEVPEKMQDTIPLKDIMVYVKGGKDPFGNDKKYIGLSEPEWLKVYGAQK